MSLIRTAAELEAWFEQVDRRNKTLGFVPTMGYLHEGHCALIQAAKAQNDLVVVSVFVNPTQFAPGEDYESYPRDIDRDYALARAAGADVVFHPEPDEIYPPGASTAVEVTGALTTKLCGTSRPTHFRGVTTVVNILFHIVRPDKAYFGQKDAQQALIIQRMVRDLHSPVEVVVCPIVREADGLAKSSRNVYLSPEERTQAVCLSRGLRRAAEYLASGAEHCRSVAQLIQIIEGHLKSQNLAEIDYVQVLDGETLDDITVIESGKKALAAVAVRFGTTRLIDNCMLSVE